MYASNVSLFFSFVLVTFKSSTFSNEDDLVQSSLVTLNSDKQLQSTPTTVFITKLVKLVFIVKPTHTGCMRIAIGY